MIADDFLPEITTAWFLMCPLPGNQGELYFRRYNQTFALVKEFQNATRFESEARAEKFLEELEVMNEGSTLVPQLQVVVRDFHEIH